MNQTTEINMQDINSILIIGMSGGLANITAGLLAKRFPHVAICGVDPREIQQSIKYDNIEYLQLRYTRGQFEKLFRDKKFDLVLHLGRMSHTTSGLRSHLSRRLDMNVVGTSRILDLCLKHQIKKILILSTYHVYGALSDNPVFISENAPLRACITNPELWDVVEMDQIATNWMWKNQAVIDSIVLRPCSIIGPQIKNSMTQYLTTPYVPIAMDFNPMFQFIHEFDMANIVIQSIQKVPTGVYNVASDETISIKEAKEFIGLPVIPAPLFLLEPIIKSINTPIWRFPHYLLDYIKYSCIIDNSELKKHLEKKNLRFSIKEALDLLRLE